MLNLLTILALEHRYIALIVSTCIVVVSVTAIVIKYFKRTKVDENNVNEVYPIKVKSDETSEPANAEAIESEDTEKAE